MDPGAQIKFGPHCGAQFFAAQFASRAQPLSLDVCGADSQHSLANLGARRPPGKEAHSEHRDYSRADERNGGTERPQRQHHAEPETRG